MFHDIFVCSLLVSLDLSTFIFFSSHCSTSNEDGVGIAWAVCEALAATEAHTLCVTHYHELAVSESPRFENPPCKYCTLLYNRHIATAYSVCLPFAMLPTSLCIAHRSSPHSTPT